VLKRLLVDNNCGGGNSANDLDRGAPDSAINVDMEIVLFFITGRSGRIISLISYQSSMSVAKAMHSCSALPHHTVLSIHEFVPN
jgi:hypothetical protein